MAKKAPLINTDLFARTDTKPQAKADKPNPLGVLLEIDEITRLDLAAAELGVSRHALLQYSVRQFLASWGRGERPKVTTQAVNVLQVK